MASCAREESTRPWHPSVPPTTWLHIGNCLLVRDRWCSLLKYRPGLIHHSAFTKSRLTHQISGPSDVENCTRNLLFIRPFHRIHWVSAMCQTCCWVLGYSNDRTPQELYGPLHCEAGCLTRSLSSPAPHPKCLCEVRKLCPLLAGSLGRKRGKWCMR